VILGIGADICAIERIAGAIERQGDRFLARVFTVAEQNAARLRPEPALYFARRFAAKEACVKALGTGITGRVRWTDIEILSEPSGRPVLTLSGGALRRARRLAPKNCVCITHVSLSDEIDQALAFVVIEAR
jgi:holo-[acyl-carrier protein] synthase